MMVKRWGQMGVSYQQLLLAQRTLFQVQADYTRALEQVWTSSVALQGMTLTDGLEPVGSRL
jgi:cobalt-zinc-cadmium efflux system outer membrane protein